MQCFSFSSILKSDVNKRLFGFSPHLSRSVTYYSFTKMSLKRILLVLHLLSSYKTDHMYLFQMPQEVYFLSTEKYRPTLFGLPLIVACSESSTYLDLYKSVWAQVSRLVSPLPPRDSSQNHATDW